MPQGIDYGALCTAVRAVLVGVSGIGTVSDRPGGVPTWITSPRPAQNYWEIDFTSASERGAGSGTHGFQSPVIRVEGWMPLSYENPDSAAVWRPLLTRVQDQLRSYPTLAGQITGWKNVGMPQLEEQNQEDFQTIVAGTFCHHALIVMTGERYFSYTVSSTIP